MRGRAAGAAADVQHPALGSVVPVQVAIDGDHRGLPVVVSPVRAGLYDRTPAGRQDDGRGEGPAARAGRLDGGRAQERVSSQKDGPSGPARQEPPWTIGRMRSAAVIGVARRSWSCSASRRPRSAWRTARRTGSGWRRPTSSGCPPAVFRDSLAHEARVLRLLPPEVPHARVVAHRRARRREWLVLERVPGVTLAAAAWPRPSRRWWRPAPSRPPPSSSSSPSSRRAPRGRSGGACCRCTRWRSSGRRHSRSFSRSPGPTSSGRAPCSSWVAPWWPCKGGSSSVSGRSANWREAAPMLAGPREDARARSPSPSGRSTPHRLQMSVSPTGDSCSRGGRPGQSGGYLE